MMPFEPVLDIMRRTMENLEFVERHANKDGPYEVTQLINSFLGALAHPWEEFQAELLQMPLADAAAKGWPIPDDRVRGAARRRRSARRRRHPRRKGLGLFRARADRALLRTPASHAGRLLRP